MKHKVSELSGGLLDAAVALARGNQVKQRHEVHPPRQRPALGCRLRGMFANALMFGLVVLGLLLIPEHPLAGLALVGVGYLASRFATRRGEDALVSVITFVGVVGACAVWARYLIAGL